MTFTWTGLVDTPLQQVRSLLSDNNSQNQLLQDEEINGIGLALYPLNVFRAAALCARQIAAGYSRKINRSAMGASDSPDLSAKSFLELAETLEKYAARNLQVYAGGLLLSEKRSLAQDPDAVQPAFGIGMDDNPRALPQTGLTGKFFQQE